MNRDLISRAALRKEFDHKCHGECCVCVERDDESGECGLVRWALPADIEPPWVSVKNRLPEDDLDPTLAAHVKSIKVLVSIKGKSGTTVRTQTRFKNTRYPGGKPLVEWKWRYSAGEVTHWMPLPKPVKEEPNG